jgi:plasmid stabilization system protein ParE
MRVQWTGRASLDLARVRDFLLPVNPTAALTTVRALRAATLKLVDHPQVGRLLERHGPREVRRLIVGQYEIRYEVTETAILIVRLWHTREDR